MRRSNVYIVSHIYLYPYLYLYLYIYIYIDIYIDIDIDISKYLKIYISIYVYISRRFVSLHQQLAGGPSERASGRGRVGQQAGRARVGVSACVGVVPARLHARACQQVCVRVRVCVCVRARVRARGACGTRPHLVRCRSRTPVGE